MTTVPFGSFCRRSPTSSRMRLQTLSTRELLAGLKSQPFSLLATGGGGGGACMLTPLEASAAPPRPSSARTVTVQVPAEHSRGVESIRLRLCR